MGRYLELISSTHPQIHAFGGLGEASLISRCNRGNLQVTPVIESVRLLFRRTENH